KYKFRNAIFVNARSLLQGAKVSESRSEKYDKKDELLKYTGLNEIQTCEAVHSKDSFSIAFRTAVGGYKITYSGDTRPNNQLVDIGRNSDLLIHEATYSNSGRDEAKLRMHSITAEAVQVGRMMNAKFTVLTHFQRMFNRIPLMEDFQDEANVGIAFDGMVVNLKSMYSIPDMYPDLNRIFEDDIKDIKAILLKAKPVKIVALNDDDRL
ncbi:zinc phosphodiesterase ELAC protein 2, partial [Eurytemora carolleeae]|uniref:zinc phosphodiesterase ELAC protein 2 n=1 Tax=Eurytemora carolleeae TaxID=1294199 RepID=UPI000C773CD7